MATTFKPFAALSIPLDGSNLIEASAGTGKTYSIAILALRLLLEKKLSVKEILMVTFTKAAVAELEERIRLFVREAAKYAEGSSISDGTIERIVAEAAERDGQDQVKHVLQTASLFLDELSVMTIHGFCQQTLNEFAFETGQFFGSELNLNSSEVIEQQTEKVWRSEVTTLPPVLLKALLEAGLSKNNLSAFVKNHLSGKPLLDYDPGCNYEWNTKQALKILEEAQATSAQELQKIYDYISQNKGRLQDLCGRVKKLGEHFGHLVDDCEKFIAAVLEKRKNQYVTKNLQDILDKYDHYRQQHHEETVTARLLQEFYCYVIQTTAGLVEQYRRAVNQLTFDDLIENLHKSLVLQQNTALVDKLQQKYRAVFIDEFQDTDRQQFEIFDTAFGKNTILFYIGDPKQSIYGWRKADIFTYFRAYNRVDHLYGMNINFRSTKAMIEAMNRFFLPRPDFDTFFFGEAENAVRYIKVDAPERDDEGQFLIDDQPAAPILIDSNFEKTGEVESDVANLILELLSNSRYQLSEKGQKRGIKPSDIGILVRSNRKAMVIKEALNCLQIPSVTVSDTMVLQSREARDVYYLMEAMHAPERGNINRALLGLFTGYQVQNLKTADEEKLLEKFKGYRHKWNVEGIYGAIMQFIHDFKVNQYLLDKETANGERIITNLYHILELLYKTAFLKSYNSLELIHWLQRNMEGARAEGGEWEQRTESDEEAVKIVTIHKSKGLQYPIVVAPDLDFRCKPANGEILTYKDPETDCYVSAKKEDLSEEQQEIYLTQSEQENRRLLYVAITRAVFRCYVYRHTGSHYKDTTLQKFTDAVQADGVFIDRKEPIVLAEGILYKQEEKVTEPAERVAHGFSPEQPDWGRMSYSMLAAKTNLVRTGLLYDGSNDYDFFIFNQLKKGVSTGNLLHYLLENIDFQTPDRHAEVIAMAIKEFAPAQTAYAGMLPALLDHVLNANIAGEGEGFRLSDIASSRRIHELEFDFPVGEFEVSRLEGITQEAELFVKDFGKLEGIMTGFIDLFFEHDGKYYILDWKSNYLGSRQEDYDTEGVEKAMIEFNYHLQYYIYTVAAKKYLESRLPSFHYERDFGGVIYCFLRGMRRGKENGVFFKKPSGAVITDLENLFSRDKSPIREQAIS